MKVVILAYITGFLLLFGLLWFDSLLQIPFAVVVLFGLLFSIWLPVKKFKSGKDNKKRWVFLLPFILVCLSIAIVFLPMRDYKVSFDHVLLASKRMEFINELQVRFDELHELQVVINEYHAELRRRQLCLIWAYLRGKLFA